VREKRGVTSKPSLKRFGKRVSSMGKREEEGRMSRLDDRWVSVLKGRTNWERRRGDRSTLLVMCVQADGGWGGPRSMRGRGKKKEEGGSSAGK